MATIVVADYDPAWKEAFAAERERMPAAVGPGSVEHIGSTAVPGLPAKPIIDLVVGVEDPAACVEPLLALGYERAEWGDFGERLFLRRRCRRRHATHHLSLTTVGSTYWLDHLAFRDALRATPSCASATPRSSASRPRRTRTSTPTRAPRPLSCAKRCCPSATGRRSGWAAGDA